MHRVAVFGDETLRVVDVEEVEGTREAAASSPTFAQRAGVSYTTADAWARILSIGRRKRRRTRVECHGDRLPVGQQEQYSAVSLAEACGEGGRLHGRPPMTGRVLHLQLAAVGVALILAAILGGVGSAQTPRRCPSTATTSVAS